MSTVLVPGVSGVEHLYLMGSKLKTDVLDRINKATFSSSVDRVTQIDLTVLDPGFKLLGSGLIQDGMSLDFIGYNFVLASIGTAGQGSVEKLEIKARPKIVRRLQQRIGAKAMESTSATGFLAAECKVVGATLKAQSTAVRQIVARDVDTPGSEEARQKKSSSWSTFARLAREEGFLMFEHKNTIYFGKPSWLIANTGAAVQVGYKTGAEANRSLEVPACSRSVDDPDGTRVGTVLPLWRANDVAPGKVFRLKGIPTFEEDFITSSLSFDLLSPAATVKVDAIKPVDPKKQTIGFGDYTSGFGTGYVPRENSKSAQDFVYWAQRQLGDRYIFGAQAKLSDPDPTAFDCAELIEWAAAQVGVYFRTHASGKYWGDLARQQKEYCALRGTMIPVATAKRVAGALLFAPSRGFEVGHVAISLGDGKRTIEARNSQVGVVNGNISSWFNQGALVPGMNYRMYGGSGTGSIDHSGGLVPS